MQNFPGKLFIFLFLITTAMSVATAQQNIPYPTELNQLHQNILTDILKGAGDRDNLQKSLDKLNDKGQWPEIDYSSKQRGDWPMWAT